MTDGVFMQWLKAPTYPGLQRAVREREDVSRLVLVLENASYHRCFDEGLKVPETNSKKYNGRTLTEVRLHAVQGGA